MIHRPWHWWSRFTCLLHMFCTFHTATAPRGDLVKTWNLYDTFDQIITNKLLLDSLGSWRWRWRERERFRIRFRNIIETSFITSVEFIGTPKDGHPYSDKLPILYIGVSYKSSMGVDHGNRGPTKLLEGQTWHNLATWPTWRKRQEIEQVKIEKEEVLRQKEIRWSTTMVDSMGFMEFFMLF